MDFEKVWNPNDNPYPALVEGEGNLHYYILFETFFDYKVKCQNILQLSFQNAPCA